MSELGKIREGSPRVYRDRVFGIRGQLTAIPSSRSVDGLIRYVVHPDDVSEYDRALAEWAVDDLDRALTIPEQERPTVFGLVIREITQEGASRDTCPACGHPVQAHYGRWCRIETGAVNREGRKLICSCEAVDRETPSGGAS